MLGCLPYCNAYSMSAHVLGCKGEREALQRCLSCGYTKHEHTAHHIARRCPKGFTAPGEKEGATGAGTTRAAKGRESLRASLLNEARELVTGDRNNSYGPPHQDFSRTAGALTAFGYRGPDGRDLEAHDVAIFVGVVKMSRLMWTPRKRDSWVDLAGYAACGFEAAEMTLKEKGA